MKWILLFLGIITDLIGSICMKLSLGFTRFYPSIFTFLCRSIGIMIFIIVLKKFNLSIAYTIWACIVIISLSIIGIIYFKEPYNIIKIIFIIVIIIGVIGLNINDILLNK